MTAIIRGLPKAPPPALVSALLKINTLEEQYFSSIMLKERGVCPSKSG